MNTLANRNPSLHNNLFAIEGELITSHNHVVEMEMAMFNILTIAVHIPTATVILTVITTDPNITKMEPYGRRRGR